MSIAAVQGVYYVATGIWPLVSMRTFEEVTGPKVDRWLVKTVGLLIGVLGGTLVASSARGGPSRDLQWAAIGSAAALTAVDVNYSLKGRISPVYLLDAVLEVVLVGLWAEALRPCACRSPSGVRLWDSSAASSGEPRAASSSQP
jgi:hypothetical protein